MWIELNYDAHEKQGYQAYESAMCDFDEDDLSGLQSLVDLSDDFEINDNDNLDDDSYLDVDADSGDEAF